MNPATRSPRHLVRTLTGALLGTVLLGAAPAEAGRPFGPGEVLTYDCQYLGMSVGKAQLMVGASTTVGGQAVWPIMGLAKTDPVFVLYPIKDKYVSWWNPASKLTIGNDLSADEKGKRRHERVRFDRDSTKAATLREKEGAKEEDTYDVPPTAQDILASYFTIREHPLKVGDRVVLPVFTGKHTFDLTASVDHKEKVEVPSGTFDTVVLKVQTQFAAKLASKREVLVYVTDDDRHIPVKIDAEFMLGTVNASLVEYQKGLAQ